MVTDTMLEKAKDILNRDFMQNVGLLECIRRKTVQDCYISGDTVVIKDEKSAAFLISADNPDNLRKATREIHEKPELVFIAQAQFSRFIMEVTGLNNCSECMQVVYNKDLPISAPACDAEIKHLDQSHADFVYRHYSNKEAADPDYITSRIMDGDAFGAFLKDNKMAGFIMTHAEGSLGILEVLPEYRGRGIASALEATAANSKMKKGSYVFGHVKLGNLASVHVQKKLGFEMAKENVGWIF